jgi:hypothetical protein
VATNSAGTSSTLPAGASYRTTGSQRQVVITGDGVDLSRWEFRIPVYNNGGAASPTIFNHSRFLGSEILAGAARYRNLYNGYDQNAEARRDGAIGLGKWIVGTGLFGAIGTFFFTLIEWARGHS